ncbi:hypothetical protein DDZ14_15150 [Maritimibacter sp. 55A14]|nr:hypothetical protein DDZ14_15150 [Maritimibacter sp. 55A14]
MATGAALLLGLTVLSGCASQWHTDYADVVGPDVSRGWRVTEVAVTVPETLTVSEANSFAPQADIVWREEPRGNRHAQVDRIISEAARKGSAGLRGQRPVTLDIEVAQFHALTEKTRTRLSHSGVHNITFTAQVRDARTGAPLTPRDRIEADLIAYSGQDAREAEARGETQRVRIVDHVSRVVAGWLGAGPDPRGSFRRRGR